MEIYNREFSFVRELQQRLEEELRFYRYVEDYFGRRYHIPLGQSYKAINAIVQGGCAQAFKQGLLQVVELSTNKYPDAQIILCPYDELQIEREIKEDEKMFCRETMKAMSEVSELMNVGLKFRVDVKRTVTNWAEKENLEI
jgi:DNA polymerase I-like protein with 3'-5' exonuclease and polymerase domains